MPQLAQPSIVLGKKVDFFSDFSNASSMSTINLLAMTIFFNVIQRMKVRPRIGSYRFPHGVKSKP